MCLVIRKEKKTKKKKKEKERSFSFSIYHVQKQHISSFLS